MNFYELIRRRQSTRKFVDRSIDREVLERIVEAARLAPSAVNSQPWHFVVVDDPEVRRAIAGAVSVGGMNKFAAQAAAFVVIVEEPVNILSRVGGWMMHRHYAHMDIGIAVEHIALAATEEGLGSCILGSLDERKVQKILGVPRGKSIPLVVALGYSEAPLREKSRKPLEGVRTFNKY